MSGNRRKQHGSQRKLHGRQLQPSCRLQRQSDPLLSRSVPGTRSVESSAVSSLPITHHPKLPRSNIGNRSRTSDCRLLRPFITLVSIEFAYHNGLDLPSVNIHRPLKSSLRHSRRPTRVYDGPLSAVFHGPNICSGTRRCRPKQSEPPTARPPWKGPRQMRLNRVRPRPWLPLLRLARLLRQSLHLHLHQAPRQTCVEVTDPQVSHDRLGNSCESHTMHVKQLTGVVDWCVKHNHAVVVL